MKKYFVFCLISLTNLTAFAQEDTGAIKRVTYPSNYTATLDVTYVKVGDWEGKLDYYIAPNESQATPVVLNFHGGGWNKGTKESQTGFNSFFKAGISVVNVEYRLTGQATAPAAVEDARCALIYVINNAKALNIDPNKIILMGGSAGAHLALMAGLLGNDNKFDNNCKSAKDIKVAAIIDKYGISDVWDWGYGTNKTSKSAISWLGRYAKDEKFAASVSPITYVNKNSPPTFIVHGDADPTVPYQHSVDLHKKFVAAGVKTEFITIPGGLHGKFPAEENSKVNKAIIQFIKSVIN